VKDIVGLQPEVQEFVHVRLVGLAPLVVADDAREVGAFK